MKLSIISKETTYNDHDRKVKVKMVCSPNLKWLEKHFHSIDARVIKKILQRYVPIQKSIVSADELTISGELYRPPQPSMVIYDYIDQFEVEGEAICHTDDTYNRETGRRIAESRAKKKAYDIMYLLCRDLYQYYRRITSETFNTLSHAIDVIDYENEHLDELIRTSQDETPSEVLDECADMCPDMCPCKDDRSDEPQIPAIY